MFRQLVLKQFFTKNDINLCLSMVTTVPSQPILAMRQSCGMVERGRQWFLRICTSRQVKFEEIASGPFWGVPNSNPEQPNFTFNPLELQIARHEFGLALFCQRSGKGIGETHAIASLEIGSQIRQCSGSGMKFNW